MRGGLRRLFGRSKTPPLLDPVGYRLPSYLVVDASAPARGPHEAKLSPGSSAGAGDPPRLAPPRVFGPSRVTLMMADGSVQDLPEDPETARQAAYYVRSMLSPPPPPPPSGEPKD